MLNCPLLKPLHEYACTLSLKFLQFYCLGKTLLWERSPVFSFLAANNKSFPLKKKSFLKNIFPLLTLQVRIIYLMWALQIQTHSYYCCQGPWCTPDGPCCCFAPGLSQALPALRLSTGLSNSTDFPLQLTLPLAYRMVLVFLVHPFLSAPKDTYSGPVHFEDKTTEYTGRQMVI